MSETPCGIRGHAPLLGEHNREILKDVIGYSDGNIATLYGDDVLHHEEAVERLPEELSKLNS